MNKKEISTRTWIMLITTCLFTFMATLDSSIINIAMPTMSKSLGIEMNKAEWIVSIYIIVICIFLILFGKIADLKGKIMIFRIGTIIFVIGSLLCGISNSLETLLFGRTIQAIGSAMTMATNYGIISQYFPQEHKGQALGILGSFVSLGQISGPAIGGLILASFTWNDIFLINIPVGIIALLLGFFSFPKEEKSDNKLKIDVVGFIFSTVAILGFFLGIFIGQEVGFNDPLVLGLFAIFAAAFVAFIAYELKHDNPLIDIRMFKNFTFSISLLSAFLVFTGMMFFSILMPFYLQNALGLEPFMASIILMAVPIAMVIVSPISGTLSDHIGSNGLTFLGLIVLCVAQLGFVFIDMNTPIYFVFIIAALSGIGLGMFQSPNNAIVMSSAEPSKLGIAGSLNSFARNLGLILGVSLSTTILYLGMSGLAGEHVTKYLDNQPNIFIGGMHIAFFVSFIIYLMATVVTGTRLRSNK